MTDLLLADCTESTDKETLTMQAGEQSYTHLRKLLEGVETGVTEQQRAELMSTLREYADVFSTGELDLGETPFAAHRIDTGDAMPMRQTLRRQPFHLLDKIDENVQNMLKAGVIEPSCSPFMSNIVVVTKKDGSLRFCVDYRRLNSVTRRDAYLLQRIDSCLDALSGARYFSAFDLRSGYHQVPMDMRDADKTSSKRTELQYVPGVSRRYYSILVHRRGTPVTFEETVRQVAGSQFEVEAQQV